MVEWSTRGAEWSGVQGVQSGVEYKGCRVQVVLLLHPERAGGRGAGSHPARAGGVKTGRIV